MKNMYVQTFSKNNKGKDFVVGDIHGRYDELMSSLDEVHFDFTCDRLFSVGDLVDRGSQHKEVVKLINEDWFWPVRGNHDQFIIDQFNDERVLLWQYRDYSAAEVHQRLEGQWFAELSNDEQVWFYNQLKGLPYLIEVEIDCKKVGICHAGLPRYIDDWEELKKQLDDRDVREQALRTRRSPKQDRVIKNINITVHGHTCFESALSFNNSNWIDTFDRSGKLTVLELRGLS